MPADDLFYIDDSQGMRISYDQLWRDVDALKSLPQVLVFNDCYGLLVTLLAAIQRNADLILVDDEQGLAIADEWLAQRPARQTGLLNLDHGEKKSMEGQAQAESEVDAKNEADAQERAPHPRPLSPEYRGEGSQTNDSVVDEATSPSQTQSPTLTVVDEATSPSQTQSPTLTVVDEATSPLQTHSPKPTVVDEATSPSQTKSPNLSVVDEATSPLPRDDQERLVASSTTFASCTCRIGLLTSGTTGKPKLVLHALDSLTRAVRFSEQHRRAVWGLAYHPAHFAGLQVFFQALGNRNPIVRLFGLESEQMHEAIEHQAITHLSATPTLMRLLAGGQRVHAGVQHITLGGERTEAELIAQLKQVFPRATFRNVYASTEVGAVLASDGDVFHVPKQYQGLVKIVDGELVVHRSLLAASLQAAGEDEFYVTGDCVEVIQHTPLKFRLLSRRGDFINVGGYKVNPHEVEDQLNGLPEVKESYVYGKPNSVTGNLVCCDVVLNVGQQLTTREVIARLKDRLPDYKIPRIARVVTTLPVTSTGKRVRAS